MSGAWIWRKATALTRRWLCVVALVVSFVRMTIAATRQAVSCPGSIARLPLVGQQLLDPAVQLRGQPREDVLHVGPRLVPVEACRLCRSPDYAERIRFAWAARSSTPDLLGIV